MHHFNQSFSSIILTKKHPFYLSDNEPLRFAPALKRSRALAEVPAFRHSFCELLISLLGRDFQKQRKDKK